jgi:response regulator RpfG family c-di-GMP phosphodiesterase
MPDMNGIEVASAIKKLSEKRRAAKPPFILLTGFGQEIMDHDKLEEYGIEKILEKPVDILVLAETAKRLVMEGR